jgi:hypothetical protein
MMKKKVNSILKIRPFDLLFFDQKSKEEIRKIKPLWKKLYFQLEREKKNGKCVIENLIIL